MLFFAARVIREPAMQNPTLVVLTAVMRKLLLQMNR
jgi:hypothetical protein